MIGSLGHLTVWAVFWVPRVLAKNCFTENRAIQLLLNIVQSFHQFDPLISRLWSKFYDQYSSDDILSKGYLMIVSVPCDMRKESIKDTFLRWENLQKKNLLNFCKSYDNEETFELLLRYHHFINPTVWYLVFGLNFMASILVMITYHNGT